MLTQFFNSINWVDVLILVLTVRFVFIAVKNGFITELCKFLGVLLSAIVSLHWYEALARFVYSYFKSSLIFWEITSFLLIIIMVSLVFWLIRIGLSQLFKAETQHQGFNKYAAGITALGRAFVVSSLIMFGLLLTQHSWLNAQVNRSISFRVAGQAAIYVYRGCVQGILAKFVDGVEYNRAVERVVSQ